MRIAQIAPLIESVPPRGYGGTERIVGYLTEGLVELGHDVTLFASGDSITSATLHPCGRQSLRAAGVRGYVPYYMAMLSQVRRAAATGAFDLLHFHIDQLHFPMFEDDEIPALTSLHGRQDLPDLQHLYRMFPSMPLVAISHAQSTPIPHAPVIGTVLHGIPSTLLTPTFNPRGGYLAFLGRISPEKRVDRAIAIAKAVGLHLKIAAKVDPADEVYFREIAPLINQPGIEFIGEINEREKERFLGDALGLLFPIDWPEPFGLVMIESMACGTPVLAFRNGSVPEVIDDGLTGIIVESVPEAVCAIPRLIACDRRAVRRQFEVRFTADRMARDYVAIYQSLMTLTQRATKIIAAPLNTASSTIVDAPLL